MTQTTMSVTRALAELKNLGSQITRAIDEGIYVAVSIGQGNNKKPAVPGVTVQQVESKIQSSFDKVDSLIDRRQKMKAAIIKSNAETQVQIKGRTFTVAEAIELKSTVVYRQQFLNTLRRHYLTSQQSVAQLQAQLDTQIENSLKTIYGNEKGKADTSQFDAVATPLKASKQPDLINPSKIEDRIAVLQDELDSYVSEIDFTLSESNARTTITI